MFNHNKLSIFLCLLYSLCSTLCLAQGKPKIAVFSGLQATILNSSPLITSNKARIKYGLTELINSDGSTIQFDHLAPQRLAAPVEIYIEMYSAHPLGKDAAELYGTGDGYIDTNGKFHQARQNPKDKAVYKVILKPEDGLYLLPYMARQANGKAWDGICAFRSAPENLCRQPFFPDASRLFEEIDRGLSGLGDDGKANLLSSKADFDFYRGVPSAGYKKGLPASERTDIGEGDIPAEVIGKDFFAYAPYHLESSPNYYDLAKASNVVKKALDSGKYSGALWLEATPYMEETVYWLNLITDTTVPIIGNVAARLHRSLSSDGPANIVDSVDYILSKQWADSQGRDDLGAVLIESEKIFSIRQTQKEDARPGGYRVTGGSGGILGTIGKPGPVSIYFRPQKLHTWKSLVNISQLPSQVNGIFSIREKLTLKKVTIKDPQGYLIGEALPRVRIVKMLLYGQDNYKAEPDNEVDIMASIAKHLESNPLAGFVAEGAAPYGIMIRSQHYALEIAAFSGIPTVMVGRGDAGGLTATNPYNVFIEGNNLTATKARYLLIASMLKFGSLPAAKDPRKPSKIEIATIKEKIKLYQQIFDAH